jgi:isoleucyl-tRNA synthetase
MNYEPLAVETKVLKFWKDRKIYEKQKALGKKGKKFYFLQGPPYTSGTFHVGHALNHTLKDMVLRYKRMNGFDVWDRGGWDMHGMPTSRKVQERFKLFNKEDIERFGVGKFVQECEKFSKEMMTAMTKDLIRWGVWLDHENAYQPITREFMEGVWWCIKEAHKNDLLYEGDRVMAWDTESETVAAKHELEYKEVTDESIYLKLKVAGRPNTFLLVWTTTPWTIPFNLAVMANPEVEYVEVSADGETWIIAKDLIESISGLTKKELKVQKEMKGKALEGLEYEPLLADELPVLKGLKKKYKWAFKVILSEEYVDTATGTGLVHCSPGSGPEDQEVGAKYGILPFNETDTRGVFSKEMGVFAGWKAREDDHKFTEYFERKGALVAKVKFMHEYPHHQRTHKPVIFRTTKQWFFAVEKVKKQMLKWNDEVNWIPKWAGGRTFADWLNNLKDIGVTRQLYWGTPLPIWRCGTCSEVMIFGSVDELKKYAKRVPANIHKPWIDEVTFQCPKCKAGLMSRIPDTGDVWVDAGCASWISLYFPHRKDLFKKYWPADFIAEAKDQIRGWFNLLFDTAAVSLNEIPFLNCYMHGWITDIEGEKMSKSKGNVVSPYDVAGKWGSDAMRYYLAGAVQPGMDMSFSYNDTEARFKNLGILWNTANFLLEFVNSAKIRTLVGKSRFDLEERYVLSRTHSTIKLVTQMYEGYRLNEIPDAIEKLYLDLSRVYIKAIRDKSNFGNDEEKLAIASTLFESLLAILKLFAPLSPFMAEELYQKLKQQFRLKEESIHLFSWPKHDAKKIDTDLERSFALASEAITSILAARDRGKISVRWPLQKAYVYSEDKGYLDAARDLKEMILLQCNIKELEVSRTKPGFVKAMTKINYDVIAKKAKEKLPKLVSKFVEISPEAIRARLSKGETFQVVVEDETFELTKDDVYFEEELPKHIMAAEFTKGTAYLDLTQTQSLIYEGFAREISRKIQSMRKDAKMVKTQRAVVTIATDDKDLMEAVEKHMQDISSRTNSSLRIMRGHSTREKINDRFDLKEKKMAIGLTPK